MSSLRLVEQSSAPSDSPWGEMQIYAKNDGKLYTKRGWAGEYELSFARDVPTFDDSTRALGIGHEDVAGAWCRFNQYDSSDNHSLEGHNVVSLTDHSTGKATVNVCPGDCRLASTNRSAAIANCGIMNSSSIDIHASSWDASGDALGDAIAHVYDVNKIRVRTQNNDVNTLQDYGLVEVVAFSGVYAIP